MRERWTAAFGSPDGFVSDYDKSPDARIVRVLVASGNWGIWGRMEREEKRRPLLASRLFAALAPEVQDDLLRRTSERTVRRGQIIFQKGDQGSYMVAVLSGRVRISDTSPDGREITLNMIDPGEVFGELALLDGKPRSADATALEECRLLQVERRHFLPYLISNHDLALRLIDVLCQRLRDTSEALGNFAMLGLPERLAHKLLNLADEYGEVVPNGVRLAIRLSHTDLSRLVGSSRETVNKQMRSWEDEGIVAREGGRILVRKPDELKRHSGHVSVRTILGR
jgi:CRP/FNR family transcriptional regulator, cyclic AMP receptor protein